MISKREGSDQASEVKHLHLQLANHTTHQYRRCAESSTGRPAIFCEELLCSMGFHEPSIVDWKESNKNTKFGEMAKFIKQVTYK